MSVTGFTRPTAETLSLIARERNRRPPDRSEARAQTETPREGLWILNDSGEAVPQYGCMAIKDGLLAAERDFAKVTKPSTTFRQLHVANGLASIAASDIGFVSNPQSAVRVAYDSGTPAYGEGWGPKPGQWTFSKGFPGFVCVGIIDSSAKIMLAERVPITQLLGKTTADISEDTDTTSYKIYTGAAGSEADGGWTTVPSARNRSGFVPSGSWIFLVFVNGHWELMPRPETMFLAKLSASLSKGGSASAVVWTGTPGSESATSVTITVYDWLMKAGATAIASGKKVVCQYINGNPYVIEAECA